MMRCLGPLSLNRPLPDVNPATLLNDIEEHALKLKSQHSKATVQAATQYGTFFGNVELKAILPDSIWMKIEGPMGIDIGIIQMQGENILFYIPYENMVYQGTLENVNRIQPMPIPVNIKALVYGLTGLIQPQRIQTDSLDNYFVLHQRYVCDYTDGDRYWIQKKGPVVTKWEHIENDTLIWSWEGDEFRKKSGVELPRIVRLKQYRSGEQLTFTFHYTRANKAFESSWNDINVPEGVMRIEF